MRREATRNNICKGHLLVEDLAALLREHPEVMELVLSESPHLAGVVQCILRDHSGHGAERRRSLERRFKQLKDIKAKYHISWRFLVVRLIGISRSQFDRWRMGLRADTAHQAIDAFFERYNRQPNFVPEEIASRRRQREREREEKHLRSC
jgi:hypothetical protein